MDLSRMSSNSQGAFPMEQKSLFPSEMHKGELESEKNLKTVKNTKNEDIGSNQNPKIQDFDAKFRESLSGLAQKDRDDQTLRQKIRMEPSKNGKDFSIVKQKSLNAQTARSDFRDSNTSSIYPHSNAVLDSRSQNSKSPNSNDDLPDQANPVRLDSQPRFAKKSDKISEEDPHENSATDKAPSFLNTSEVTLASMQLQTSVLPMPNSMNFESQNLDLEVGSASAAQQIFADTKALKGQSGILNQVPEKSLALNLDSLDDGSFDFNKNASPNLAGSPNEIQFAQAANTQKAMPNLVVPLVTQEPPIQSEILAGPAGASDSKALRDNANFAMISRFANPLGGDFLEQRSSLKDAVPFINTPQSELADTFLAKNPLSDSVTLSLDSPELKNSLLQILGSSAPLDAALPQQNRQLQNEDQLHDSIQRLQLKGSGFFENSVSNLRENSGDQVREQESILSSGLPLGALMGPMHERSQDQGELEIRDQLNPSFRDDQNLEVNGLINAAGNTGKPGGDALYEDSGSNEKKESKFDQKRELNLNKENDTFLGDAGTASDKFSLKESNNSGNIAISKKEALAQQLNNTIKTRIENATNAIVARGSGAAKLQFKDSVLGQVSVSLNISVDKKLYIQMHVQDDGVKSTMEKDLSDLKSSLGKTNPSFSDIVVDIQSVKEPSSSNFSDLNQKNESDSKHRPAQDFGGDARNQNFRDPNSSGGRSDRPEFNNQKYEGTEVLSLPGRQKYFEKIAGTQKIQRTAEGSLKVLA